MSHVWGTGPRGGGTGPMGTPVDRITDGQKKLKT